MNHQIDYRNKYSEAVRKFESKEQQYSAKVEWLAKTLFQVSHVAASLDPDIEGAVFNLRDAMRDGKNIIERLEDVTETVKKYEIHKTSEAVRSATTVKAIVDQYRAFQLPNELQATIDDFSEGLPSRMKNYNQYHIIIDELLKLQSMALEVADIQNGCILHGDITIEQDTQVDNNDEREKQALKALSNATNFHKDQAYQRDLIRIEDTLKGLINNIHPRDDIKDKLEQVKARVDAGLNWHVLALTLEDVRDIIFAQYLFCDKGFNDYITEIGEELSEMTVVLTDTVEIGRDFEEATSHLTENVSHGVACLKRVIDEDDDIEHLKKDLSSCVAGIVSEIEKYKSRPSNNINQQLEELLEKVKRVEEESEKTKLQLAEQMHKATHDCLTGLPNREAYQERVDQEYQRFKRYGSPLTIAVCDIDHFKSINDTHGHQAGDKILILIARAMETHLRKVDFIARYGGEEFVILLPETKVHGAFIALDKIRSAISKTVIKYKGDAVNISISFGVTQYKEGDTTDVAFERADSALYDAKNQGRNRCIIG